MRVEFHFDFGSPNAYLSHKVLPAIAARTGVTIEYVPVLIGGVFKATNNVSPMVSLEGILNKPAYNQLETERFIKRHGINDYHFNPHFPVNTLQIMRGAVFAATTDYFAEYVDAVYKHMWAEPKKMDDIEVVTEALRASGLPVDEILAGSQKPEVKQSLIDNTQRSVEMGAFGSPTFFVNKDMYFGKDRLREFEERILEEL